MSAARAWAAPWGARQSEEPAPLVRRRAFICYCQSPSPPLPIAPRSPLVANRAAASASQALALRALRATAPGRFSP